MHEIPDWLRDTILFFVGLGGVIHEAVFYEGGERPSLLILFAAMMGLPLYLRRNGKNGGSG